MELREKFVKDAVPLELQHMSTRTVLVVAVLMLLSYKVVI